MDALPTILERICYELRFGFLFDAGRAYSFPCDSSGNVDMASLTETGRRSYHHACEVVGREVSIPAVQLDPTCWR